MGIDDEWRDNDINKNHSNEIEDINQIEGKEGKFSGRLHLFPIIFVSNLCVTEGADLANKKAPILAFGWKGLEFR